MTNEVRNSALQALCRAYLYKLRNLANKYGLGAWLEDTIKSSTKDECNPTEEEVMLLARCVNEERIARTDIPKILNKSYRECNDNGDFYKIKKLNHVGIYSKVSALLYANNNKLR